MKAPTLFLLGGLAIILAQVLALINNALYLLQGDQPPDMFRVLLNLLGHVPIFTLGLMALYASMAKRGGVVGLIAFLLLFYSYIGDIASWTMNLAVVEGITTQDQINQISFNTAASNVILSWFYWLGLLLFGYAIFRSGVYPKVAGVLVALIAPVSYVSYSTGLADFMTPIFILLSFGVWVWSAEQLARKLDMSLSEPYTVALATYVNAHQTEHVTEALNRVYETEASTLEPGLVALQVASISDKTW